MVGMGLGLGLGLGGGQPAIPATVFSNGGPELLLQAEIVHRGDETSEGILIRAVAIPWLEIVEHTLRDPNFLIHFTKNHRAFEEFIAATYDRAGFDEVILTPQSGDRGRDVIAIKKGFGSIKILEQCKAYKPGHRVTHNDIRAALYTTMADSNSSKAIVTTTSEFEPGILLPDSEFARFMPFRLELKDRVRLLAWLSEIKLQQRT